MPQLDLFSYLGTNFIIFILIFSYVMVAILPFQLFFSLLKLAIRKLKSGFIKFIKISRNFGKKNSVLNY